MCLLYNCSKYYLHVFVPLVVRPEEEEGVVGYSVNWFVSWSVSLSI